MQKAPKCQNTLQSYLKTKMCQKKPLELPQEKTSSPSKNSGEPKKNENPQKSS